MELDALDRIAAVPHGHDLAVVGGRAQFEVLRQRCAVDRERMVAPGRNGIRKTLEDGAAIVSHETRLPVEDPRGMADLPAVRCPDPLMAEANAERRGPPDQYKKDISTHAEIPRVGRMAWPGREHDRIRRKLPHLFHRDAVVAIDARVGSDFPNLLVQVVHEGIVVVDDEDLHAAASRNAARKPSSLCSVSNHSLAGSESATIPAPACM